MKTAQLAAAASTGGPREWAPRTKIDWKSGLCRGMGSDFFFDQTSSDEAFARSICGACPIRISCGIYGLTQAYGMWGGLTEKERRALKVTRRKSICTSCSMRDVTITMQNGSRVSVCEACGISEPW